MNDLSTSEFAELVNKPNVVILDVRTPQEFEAGHLKNSELFDFYGEEFQNEINKLDRSLTYAIYCRSGHRSGETTDLMHQLGFKNIYNLAGGILDWQASGNLISK